MAETLVSPGVLATETDTSFVTQGPIQAGAAILGPTVKGPVNIPTLVTSYSDYQNKFGTTFISGGSVYTYFTSIAAYNYFQNGGNTLLVSRIVSGTYAPATSTTILNTVPSAYVPGAFSSASFNFGTGNAGNTFSLTPEVRFSGSLNGTIYTYRFLPTQSGTPSDETTGTTQVYFYASGSTITASLNNLISKINSVSNIGIVANNVNNTTVQVTSSVSASTYNNFIFVTGSGTSFQTQATMGGGIVTGKQIGRASCRERVLRLV